MAKTLADLIIEKKLVDPTELKALIKESTAKKIPLINHLIEKQVVSEKDIYPLKSKLLGVPFKAVDIKDIDKNLFKLIPVEAVQHYKFIPISVDAKKKIIEVGMLEPGNVEARQALKFIAHRNNLSSKIYLISASNFKEALNEYISLKGEVQEALGDLESELEKENIVLGTEEEENRGKISEDAPITRVVATILNHAIEQRASDIHIEPTETETKIRFRVDGALRTNLILPQKTHSAIISRIKILSNLKIDETRIPQDGRFYTNVGKKKIDFRVSTFPTYAGEKVVMRILDPTVGLRKLSELGIEGRNLQLLQEAIKRPFGLILITGPTGSGKTTTLYSILNLLNKEDVNIVSLEDPIEYYIEGINQSQVRSEIGYTFASGLRHILRQDPDKIMVGEIRDNETAALAMHAALTGHLVLSTLHTNDSLGVIPRLIDMGIDPYLIPPTLILAVAQRLVRRLCPESKEALTPSAKIKEVINKEIADIKKKGSEVPALSKPFKLYGPKPAKTCPRGTKGRVAIYEMLSMSPQLEEVILKEPSESKIKEEADRQGMLSMLQDGLTKAAQGLVSFEEVVKMVEES